MLLSPAGLLNQAELPGCLSLMNVALRDRLPPRVTAWVLRELRILRRFLFQASADLCIDLEIKMRTKSLNQLPQTLD